MSNIKLQAAREFIVEKNYDAARSILMAMPSDPTAQSWLARLNEIAPEKRSSRLIDDPKLARHKSKPKKPRIGWRKILLLLLIIVGVLAIVVVVLSSRSRMVTDEQKREFIVDCMHYYLSERECQDVMVFVTENYSDELIYCYQEYSNAPDIYSRCIGEQITADISRVSDYGVVLFIGCTYFYRTDQTVTGREYTYTSNVEAACNSWVSREEFVSQGLIEWLGQTTLRTLTETNRWAWISQAVEDGALRTALDTCWNQVDPQLFTDSSRADAVEFAECYSATSPMPVISRAY